MDDFARSLERDRSVVMSGPPGCGRSALLRGAAALAAGRGAVVSTIVASTAMGRLPLGALAARFADRLPAGAAGHIATAEGVAAITAALLDGAPAPVVVVVDDAHLLDDLSAAVLLDLVASRRATVILAVRSDHPAPDSVASLWKDDHADLITVDHLTDDSVEDLVGSMVGGPIDPRSLRALLTASGGRLPLLLALVEAAKRTDRVSHSGGLRKISAGTVDDDVIRLCAASLTELDDGARLVIDVLSVARSASINALLATTSERTLDDLERAGIIAVDVNEDGALQARLRVPLLADACKASSGTLARRRRLAVAAAAFDSLRCATAADRLSGALLHLELGDRLDPATALATARIARSLARRKDAAALASAAAASGAGAQATLLLAAIDSASGRPSDADARLRQLYVDTSTAPRTDETAAALEATLAATAVARVDNLLFGLFQPQDALRVLESAAERVADPRWTAQLAVRRAVLAFVGGDITGAGQTVEPFLADTSGNALVAGCFLAAFGCTMAGRFRVALDLLDRAAAVPEAGIGDDGDLPAWDRPSLETIRCLALTLLGQIGDAEAVSKRAHRAAIDSDDAVRQGLFAWCRGGVALDAGRPKASLRRSTEAAALMAAGGQTTPRRLVLHDMARAQALLGRIDDAQATLAEADAIGDATTSDLGIESGRLRARAWVEAADGALIRARELLRECAQTAADRGEVINELMARYDCVRFGATDEADRLDELAARCDGEVATAVAQHARGMIERRSVLLAAAADTFERLGRTLGAAEAAATLAEVLAADGDAREAAKMAVRSGALRSRCEGASTPVLTSSNVVSILSPRETEVANLAARGLSNKDIAARLFVSARTVESQLQRSYTKLGIRRRDELPDALALLGDT